MYIKIQDNTQIEAPQYEDEPEPVVDQSESTEASDQSEAEEASEPEAEEPEVEADDSAETDAAEAEESDQSETEDQTDELEDGKTSDNEEFETQTVKTKLTVGEKAHNMCDLALVDTNVYRHGFKKVLKFFSKILTFWPEPP